MAKQENTVTVQNIKNPALTRQMTVNSAKMNSRKWRIIDSTLIEEPKKKEAAKPVAVGKPALTETGNSFVNDDLASSGEFAKISDEAIMKESLQADYEKLSGKKPDGRWNEDKLKAKIKELTQNDDEAA